MYAFLHIYNTLVEAGKTIQADPKWDNGTGYLDHIVNADLGITMGEQRAFVAKFDRRAVVTRTPFGNVVVFERYTPKDEQEKMVIVSNEALEITDLYGPNMASRLSEDMVVTLLGAPGCPNVGQRLLRIGAKLVRAAQEGIAAHS